ncbi:MAG TPA: SpoIIE family protein phosphatase [Terriglobales bacterium]|nr:SpoIIE family protein phosphatase [Terriglobales bacterium]
MHSFFHQDANVLSVEPVSSQVPALQAGELAAMYYGERKGGDFYDFLRVSPNRVVFGLLDVAGRSEENHVIVAAAKKTFREKSLELLSSDTVNEADAMTEICLRLNHTILEIETDGVRSCPAFVGCYNESLGILCYTNAGHTPALLRDGSGIAELPATGLPLGLFSHATCDAPMAAISPGAALLLVSRGIVEGRHRGEEFGLEGAKKTLRQSAATAKDLCRTVIEDVRQFMRKPPTHNDVTAVALVRNTS